LSSHDLSHQQHSHYQFWINQGPSSGAVKLSQMRPNAGQINDTFNRSQHMIRADVILYREIIEKSRLCFVAWSENRMSPKNGHVMFPRDYEFELR